jgi:F0F1-type ATP synthase assembly protein I
MRGYTSQMDLLGWLVFLVSSLFFLLSGVRNGDVMGVIGSALFFVACVLFIVPLLRERGR